MMFTQGSFINEANATPESIALKRAQIAALMPRFGQAKYVGEGLGQLATGIGMGFAGRKLDKAESAGRQSAQERFNAILGGGIQGTAQPGGFSVLGNIPMADAPAPNPNSPHALGNDTMAALGKAPIQTAADPASIRQGLIDRGLPEHVADGFVMNFQDESGLNPGINEIAPLVPGSRGGFGLYQLTGPRRRAYEAWAAERGIPLDSVDGQLDFMMTELQGPEAAAASRIMAAPDAGSAAAEIVTNFLRPSPEHRDRRVAEYRGGNATMSDAMNSPQMAAATVPMDALISIISDPWATPDQKAMAQTMLDQQTQMNDPAYRMGLRADELAIQKAQMEIDQMGQPQTPAQLAERQALAAAGGLQPGTPEYQAYMLTGEMPQSAPKPLTAEERQYWGIPSEDTRPYVMGSDGAPEPIGGGGVTVNNDLGGGKFDDEFAKGDAASLVAVSDAGNMAMRNLGRIDQLDTILSTTPTGAGAAFAQAAGEFGINTEGLDEIQSAQAIINSLVPEQRQPGSGPMSDADLALFKQSLPRIINQPGGNQTIIQTMRGIAQYDAEGAQIVQRLRAGEFGSGPTARAKAFELLQGRKNPLADFKPPAGSSPEPAPAPADGGLAVGTIEDGWEYIGGDPAQPESWREVQ